MQDFLYEALPTRVLFGSGTLAQLGAELDRLSVARPLLIATPQQAEQIAGIAATLGDRCGGVFAEAAMHTPVEVTALALAFMDGRGIDGFVAVGGGSTTGLGKALALRTGLPQLVVPTTYAGSEMTPILGETEKGLKTTQRTLRVLPQTVIYDVDLTLSLPAGLSGTSGVNAIAHAVEALYARDRNPVVCLMAEEGIRALAGALRAIARDPSDRRARSDALYGAWLCGICLGTVGMSLHHKLCHTLGGTFNLPHAETHSVVLPHALAYNTAAAPEAAERVARALGVADAAAGLHALNGTLGTPRSLRDLGMPEDGIARAAALALKNPYWNPAPLTAEGIDRLVRRAWAGEAPAA